MEPNPVIALAENPHTIARCFPVMVQLRPQLVETEFIARIERQRAQGYRLAYLEAAGRICALAGYRFGECLAWGRFCYVDDLVTHAEERSHGYGGALLDWVIARAREAGCERFELDSGVQRFGAHRFYLAKRMDITSHHFGLVLA